MKMPRTTPLLALLLFALALPANGAQTRKRVALLDFDFSSVHSWWSGDWDVGRGIADLIVTSLVRDGTYSVIERKKLDAILQEQDFSKSDRADPATAAKIGRILGVNAIIVGSVTQFGLEEKSLTLGGIGGTWRGFGAGTVGTKEGKAQVAVDARMVDVNTGEIVAVGTGKGESKRSGLLLDGAGAGGGGFGGGGIDMSSSHFSQTILGEATRTAVEQLSEQLVTQAGKIEGSKIVVQGLIADVSGGIVIINVGKNAGAAVGMRLSVDRVGREVKDPATGKVLRRMTTAVGEIEITEADEISAVARIVWGEGLKVGDEVKNK